MLRASYVVCRANVRMRPILTRVSSVNLQTISCMFFFFGKAYITESIRKGDTYSPPGMAFCTQKRRFRNFFLVDFGFMVSGVPPSPLYRFFSTGKKFTDLGGTPLPPLRTDSACMQELFSLVILIVVNTDFKGTLV